MTIIKKTLLLSFAGAFAIACGPGPKPQHPNHNNNNGNHEENTDPEKIVEDGTNQVQERDLTADMEKDFEAAVKFHKEKTKDGWTSAVCDAVADRWHDVANKHKALVEARFNAGMAHHQCGDLDKAEENYQKALKIFPKHAASISNLGDIYWQRGDAKKAEEYWKKAANYNRKLIAARANIAYLMLEKLRKMDYKSNKQAWRSTEKQIRDELSSVLAVDQEHVKAYVLYGLVYLEGSERNKDRLALAKLLLDEAAKRDENYAPLHNARGLLYLRRSSPGLALEKFLKAVELDPGFSEARMNVGNITLGFRKYKLAAEQFSEVLKKDSKNYDANIGLGIAQRGMGNLKEAEDSYEAALKIDKNRGEAYFNLGVLYKDFHSNKASDIKGSQAAYKKAQQYFEDFLRKPGQSADDKQEAQENIKDCKKTIKQIDDVIKAMAEDAKGGNG